MKLSDFLGDMNVSVSFWLLRSVPETAKTALFVAEAETITNLDDKRFFWRMTVPEIVLQKYAHLLNQPSDNEVPRLRASSIPVHGTQMWKETTFIDEAVVEDNSNDALPYFFRFHAPRYAAIGSVQELGATRILSSIISEQKLGPCLVQPEWVEDRPVIQVRLPTEADAILAKAILFEAAEKMIEEVFV